MDSGATIERLGPMSYEREDCGCRAHFKVKAVWSVQALVCVRCEVLLG